MDADRLPATVPARIAALRAALRRHGLWAWVAPSTDPHLSEYPPERWSGRAWLSGFTGSAGTLVVTAEFAGLWVDGRYWVQADAELDGSGIEAQRAAGAASTAWIDWLGAQAPAGGEVGIDGSAFALASARALDAALVPRGARLRSGIDLLDEVWGNRPGLPAAPVRERGAEFEPRSRADKLALVRAAMESAGADWHLVSTLDDIAWTLNLRGDDIPMVPVFVAHLLLGRDQALLFTPPEKIDAALRGRLAADGVTVEPYGAARARLAALPPAARLLLDPRRVGVALAEAAPAAVARLEAVNPALLMKSRKSEGELQQVRATMERDGAALCEFFAGLESALARGEQLTEIDIDTRVTAARARQPGFLSPSFPTIAGFNANAAAPHYRARPESHALICDPQGPRDGLLLIDSGGQYEGGTTDITRMVAIGRCSPEQRRDVTLVLRGMIALARARFPRGTRAPMLDSLARAPIWAEGIDYNHGTGHGVGYCLAVHEGPQSISPFAPAAPESALEPGMITSDEPGIYRPGQWGVRIENLLLTVPAPDRGFGEFLAFETLTLCPIDRACLDAGALRADERAWLDAYHAEVRLRLAPLLTGEALAWMQRATAPLA